MAIRSSFPFQVPGAVRQKERGQGEKGHIIEVTRSCARRTAALPPG